MKKKYVVILVVLVAFVGLLINRCSVQTAMRQRNEEEYAKLMESQANRSSGQQVAAAADSEPVPDSAQAETGTVEIRPDTDVAAQAEAQALAENVSEPQTGAVAAPESGTYEIGGIRVTYYSTVHNDKTGNLRLAVIYDGSDLNSYVADFYKDFVVDDAEILGIVNLGLKTVVRVDEIMEGWLDVTISEYTDGEEHDAIKLFSGDLLNHYWINMETGEIDNLEE